MTGFALLLTAAAAATFTPARLASGDAPVQPLQTVGWGEAALELVVGDDGDITRIDTRGGVTPYIEALRAVVDEWSFTPADEDEQPVGSRVLVIGVFRPPLLLDVGTSLTAPTASPGVPRPFVLVPPPYPPLALGDGVVVVEVRVDEKGQVVEAQAVVSAPGFDGAAADTARAWRFRPALREGVPVAANVYLVFGFRQPI